jgi:drug/metabolite transporter (DMT)-like permease
LLGWLLANEELNARIAVASAIIIGSVIFINYARQLAARRPEEQLVPEEIE